MDQFNELFLQREPTIYPKCLHIDGYNISLTHQMSRII